MMASSATTTGNGSIPIRTSMSRRQPVLTGSDVSSSTDKWVSLLFALSSTQPHLLGSAIFVCRVVSLGVEEMYRQGGGDRCFTNCRVWECANLRTTQSQGEPRFRSNSPALF